MQYDLIVVGGGIVGLGHAWVAAKAGHSVAVFESGPRAEGASIRNFGMVWPIGQPVGPARELALRSRELWLELATAAECPVHRCGSIHLAHHDDEFAVLSEFASSSTAERLDLDLLDPAGVRERTPAANPEGLRGGLFSGTELRVHPPTAISSITSFLANHLGVDFHFGQRVVSVDSGEVMTADRSVWTADRVLIASGASFETLFPETHVGQRLRVCKLQMLLSVSQPDGFRIGPHLASGLTLRHYPSFAGCPSLPAVRDRIAETLPELDRYGIHVMASQTDAGELILGDSHEYGDDIEPMDKAEIDDLILRELRKIMNVPNWTIRRRWHGLYAKHPTELFFVREVRPDVLVVNGLGGNGMTLSLGVADQIMNRWQTAPEWSIPQSAS